MDELEKKLEEIAGESQKVWSELKETIEVKEAEIKKLAKDDVVLTEKIENLNKALDEKLDQYEAVQKKIDARLDEHESALKRKHADSPEDERKQAELAKEFSALCASEVSGEALAQYKSALYSTALRGHRVGADEIKALSVGADPDGGYWVTPDTSGRIVEFIHETSPMRQFASVQSISTDALEGPRDLQRAGARWASELQARSETATPQIGKYRIPVHELHAQPRASQQLLDDASIDVEAWLQGKVATEFALSEATAFVAGDGVDRPRGFVTYPDGVPSGSNFEVIQQSGTGASGNFAATNPADIFHTVMAELKQPYHNGAIWAMNRTTKAAVRKIKDGDGTYLLDKAFASGQPNTILGHQVAIFEDMADIGADSLSIAFANFGQGYQIVDRIGIRVLRDPYTAKPFVLFDTTKRVGGDVVNFEAIKLIKFG